MSKKIGLTLIGCLLAAGLAQATTLTALTDIDSLAAVDDYSYNTFTGTVTTAVDNWGRNDNLTGAVFSDTTITVSGNQPFLEATITDADFSGATFNITTYLYSPTIRFNAFKGVTGTGASFVNSTWNFTLLSATSLDKTDFFSNGAGATDSASQDDAFDFSGAEFNFDGAGLALTNEVVEIIIGNLGSTGTGDDAFGAFYDDTFANKNYSAFGYDDADELATALDAAGWQAIPEPATLGLFGLSAVGILVFRRRHK